MLLLVLLAVLAGLALWLVPEWQIAPAREELANQDQLAPADRLLLDKELFQAETAARSTLALIFAAGGLLLGLGLIWRRYELSRQLQTHERFAAAVEQLAAERADASPRTESRLGGIYALERLAGESDREYWPVMEVLTAYVRENAAWTPARASLPARPGADIQAIVAVLGRRRSNPQAAERRLLDLRETDLRGVNLSGMHLESFTFQGAHLEQADISRASLCRSNLREAHLAGASLTESDLEGASLTRADLQGARLNGANFRGADLSSVNLQRADLWEANLKSANLKDADLRGADLTQCVLEEAILWRADLQESVLTAARLRETHLERANLANASGLTWEQGEDAFTDEYTILPDYLVPEQARHAPPALAAGPMQVAPAPPPAATEAPAPRAARPSHQPKNVVQMPPSRGRKHSEDEPPAPKKASVPKHRKQGLVKPA